MPPFSGRGSRRGAPGICRALADVDTAGRADAAAASACCSELAIATIFLTRLPDAASAASRPTDALVRSVWAFPAGRTASSGRFSAAIYALARLLQLEPAGGGAVLAARRLRSSSPGPCTKTGWAMSPTGSAAARETDDKLAIMKRQPARHLWPAGDRDRSSRLRVLCLADIRRPDLVALSA